MLPCLERIICAQNDTSYMNLRETIDTAKANEYLCSGDARASK